MYFNACADEVMVLLTPEPASFTDAYAVIKSLNSRYKIKRFHIVTNMVNSESDGLMLFRRFQDVVLRFLNVSLKFAGSIPMDNVLRNATINQRLVYRQHSQSSSAPFIDELAYEIESMRIASRVHEKGFFEEVAGLA